MDEADLKALVVMGVSGSGKTTVAAAIAARVGALFLDADDFHPAANTAKMAAGVPLTDEDRWPWLALVGDEIARRVADGERVVMACSALRRRYRDVLRASSDDLVFAQLDGSRALLGERIGARTDHFMPVSLLGTQLRALEPLEKDERGFVLDIAQTPDHLADTAVTCWQDIAELARRRERET